MAVVCRGYWRMVTRCMKTIIYLSHHTHPDPRISDLSIPPPTPQVCKNWKKHIRIHCSQRSSLDMDVFWSFIGKSQYENSIGRLMSMFPSVSTLRLGYCHQLTDRGLRKILQATQDRKQKIETLDLFYCHELTSQGIAHVVELCPDLTELSLNFCVGINNDAIIHLSRLRHLRVLDMRSLSLLTGDIWNLFQEHEFESLCELNLKDCKNVEHKGILKTENGQSTFSFESNSFMVHVESKYVEGDSVLDDRNLPGVIETIPEEKDVDSPVDSSIEIETERGEEADDEREDTVVESSTPKTDNSQSNSLRKLPTLPPSP
ncbi:hypothetical protein AAMO2058_001724200 [Amorphochlora amoebiformis]